MEPDSAAMKKLLDMVEEQRLRLERQQAVMVEGFALAFKEATGLDPADCQMIIEQDVQSDFEKNQHTMVQRIHFQRRRAF